MRILLVHNRYQIPGGEDTVVAQEKALLEVNGHSVSLFEDHNDRISGGLAALRTGLQAVYSLQSRLRATQEIQRFRPDIMHVHNFFPLISPSVYDAAKTHDVAVVQTLHNFRLTCVNGLLFRDGHSCTECVGKSIPFHGIQHKCYRDSRTQSLAVALMSFSHQALGTWKTKVDRFLALSEFQKRIFIQAGLPADRVSVKPNFVSDSHRAFPVSKEYAMFVGRLSPEKGVEILLNACRDGLKIPIVIVGEGPSGEVWRKEASNFSNIRFVGRKSKEEVQELMAEARFLVFPSQCFEGFPLVLAEAFAAGKPVVASDIGGIPEIVQADKTGWLVEPTNVAAWRHTLEAAWRNPDLCNVLGKQARAVYDARYAPAVNYRMLMEAYQLAIRFSKNNQTLANS